MLLSLFLSSSFHFNFLAIYFFLPWFLFHILYYIHLLFISILFLFFFFLLYSPIFSFFLSSLLFSNSFSFVFFSLRLTFRHSSIINRKFHVAHDVLDINRNNVNRNIGISKLYWQLVLDLSASPDETDLSFRYNHNPPELHGR